MKWAFSSLVEANAKKINVQLRALGIPYKVVVDVADQEEKTASYCLRHVHATSNADMRDSMSFGERNLFSLLLFLHNEEDGIILIDDPASSYDEYRRSQIYDCIMNSQEGKTVLVVSHDHAFVRRAVSDTLGNVGNIFFMTQENNATRFIPVSKNSFVNLDDEIVRRIKIASSYIQKMINIRLFFDLHKNESQMGWEYSSAVLHQTPRHEILDILAKHSLTEQDILSEMQKALGNEVTLEAVPEYYGQPLSADMTDFETLIYARELLNQNKGSLDARNRADADMLNDLVHMNDCMLFTLNPYEYPIWSPELQALVAPCRMHHMS